MLKCEKSNQDCAFFPFLSSFEEIMLSTALPAGIAIVQFHISILTLAIKNVRLVLMISLTWRGFIYISI